MIKALWISGGLAAMALFAMLKAPPGQADAFGTLLRTAAATALLVVLGRLVGAAEHRRPPIAIPGRVLATIVVTVATLVTAVWFSPDWSIALAAWYLTLFATGFLLNRVCEAPDRYAVLVAAFSVVLSSLILMTLSLATSSAQPDPVSSAPILAVWRNVGRIAGHPGDAAWTWLAWRVADRLRPREPNRRKVVPRISSRTIRPKPRV